MSLFHRGPERRHATDVPSLLQQYRDSRLASSITVNSDTALRHTAVWGCVRLIAGTSSTLPVAQIATRGGRRIEVDPASRIIASPSAIVSPITWRDMLFTSLLLRGNAYGLITEVDRAGYPLGLELIHPDRVSGRVENGRKVISWDGVDHDLWPLGDGWHVPAFTVPGNPFGLSVIEYARTTIAGGLAAEAFGTQFFTEGATPSAVLTSDQVVTKEQAQELKSRFMSSVNGRREPAVLGQGMSYQPISVRPDESQFLDTQRFSNESIARIFGVPPEMIGSATSGQSITYANTEQRISWFLMFSLSPWLARVEEALTALLPSGQSVKFRTGGLLRADIATRFSVYESAARIGRMTGGQMPLTVDEMRALEDLPPLQ